LSKDKLADDLIASLESYSPPKNDLQSVAGLAAELRDKAALVDRAENNLRTAKEEYNEICNKLLPSAMDSLGLSELTLDDGTKIGVETFYQASISKDAKDAAFDWLDSEGHGDIIKHEVKVSLKKGQREEAETACRALTDAGLDPNVDMSVHTSTLKAFVREEIEQGRTIDPSINVFVGRRSKVT